MWANDNKTIFYTTEDPVSKRSDKFWRHVVGSDKSDLLYEEKNELFDLGAGRSLDKKIVFLSSNAMTSREIRYLPADNPTGEFKIVLARADGHEYDVDHYNNQFYITTNKNAKNFRVVTAPISDPSEKNWKPFIDHNPKVKIDGLTTLANHLVVSEKEGGLNYLRVIDMKKKQSHRITTDEPDYALFLGGNPEFDTTTVRFNYQSMVTPNSVYEYDMNTRQRTKKSNRKCWAATIRRTTKPNASGRSRARNVKVPTSLVYKKGVKFDGTAPMLLYAYGSYGASMAPTFSSSRLALLDRGVVYALSYIRGGGELGEEWREQGRMMKNEYVL